MKKREVNKDLEVIRTDKNLVADARNKKEKNLVLLRGRFSLKKQLFFHEMNFKYYAKITPE